MQNLCTLLTSRREVCVAPTKSNRLSVTQTDTIYGDVKRDDII